MKKGLALCHPERKHKAHGLCKACYSKRPDQAIRIKAYTDKHSLRDRLKCLYGITPAQLTAMKDAQNNLCAICGKDRGKLVVDHNHTTGNVRKLLCIPCNRALGYFENPDWASKAAAYLAQPLNT